ncbi:MAG: hypothetical protein ACM3ML_03735 [Micromonosporaceae bacterium]
MIAGRNRLAPVPGTGASHGERQDNVPQSLQVVFGDAGDAERPVSDASFDGWYEQHLGEILSIPGFTSAQHPGRG